jgi:hypothetical protein
MVIFSVLYEEIPLQVICKNYRKIVSELERHQKNFIYLTKIHACNVNLSEVGSHVEAILEVSMIGTKHARVCSRAVVDLAVLCPETLVDGHALAALRKIIQSIQNPVQDEKVLPILTLQNAQQ